MICTSISEKNFERCLDIINNSDMAEIRLELCEFNIEQIKTLFSSGNKLIAAYRPGSIDEFRKKEYLITAIESGAEYIDLEYDTFFNGRSYEGIIRQAKLNLCKIIVSYHNYEETPEINILKSIVIKCLLSDADIVKIACKANNPEDNITLLSLYNMASKKKKIISIGMGEIGRITRIAGAFLGAPFTYASAEKGHETSDGQFDRKTIEDIIRTIRG